MTGRITEQTCHVEMSLRRLGVSLNWGGRHCGSGAGKGMCRGWKRVDMAPGCARSLPAGGRGGRVSSSDWEHRRRRARTQKRGNCSHCTPLQRVMQHTGCIKWEVCRVRLS
ncbi:unnamed protein product [Peronospora belbahrii]|uniref:Uncharacterized protein n=1 Tax=Peronospora belbahrii TaxID=622444 RepID=A0ABN8CPI1_9STRA|nr:unnamed protein product [Peronospora belbahrii]